MSKLLDKLVVVAITMVLGIAAVGHANAVHTDGQGAHAVYGSSGGAAD